jgi:hypothetical protein
VIVPRRLLRASSVLLASVFASCELEPGRTGTCQAPVALTVGAFERAESYHDDCRGPNESGDIFTLSLAAQANLEVNIVPEGSFAPTFAIYGGNPGDADPPLVAGVTAGMEETLAVRLFLAPGSYFIVAGTSTRNRATYRILAIPSTGADCTLWNFVTKGVDIDGEVTASDCQTLSSPENRAESFELWWGPNDTLTITVVADSAGFFQMRESCCTLNPVFTGSMSPGDTISWGRRALPERRPHRITFLREVMLSGPGTYRMTIE